MTEPLVVQQPGPRPQTKMAALMGSVSAIMARMAFAAGLGVAFNGARNYYDVLGYKLNPTHMDFVQKYLRQDVAQRIIKAPVDALWTDPPIVDGGARFSKQWAELAKEHDIYTWLGKVDIFAGLGWYACLLVGYDDGRSLDQPVNTGRKNKITFLQPYLQGSIEIQTLENDPTNPRYGMPILYKITPGYQLIKNSSALANKSPGPFMVHFSRILHLADNTLENTIVGHSRLEPIYNTLDDLMKVTGGAAETYWLTANRGMHVDIDKDLELESEDANDLADEIDEYSNGLRRVIRTRGVKINSLGSDVADPRGVFNALVGLLASNTGIPQRVLMGAEAGQLASQQDRANWSVQVEQRQQNWGGPLVLKPFVKMQVRNNVISEPSKELEFDWPEAFKMNPFERGQTSAQQARSITNVSRAMETAQKVGMELISIEEARQITAPGPQLLVLDGLPKGTFPPKLIAPVNDPQNALDLVEKQGEIQADAAEAAAKRATENPPQSQPFGGNPNGA